MRYYYKPPGMAKIKMTTNAKHWEGCGANKTLTFVNKSIKLYKKFGLKNLAVFV